MHQILHLIDFRCTFLQRNQDVNEDKEMVGKDQSTRNFEMFDQIMLDWIYLARVGMTVHKYLMVWSIHLMINHWFVSEWQWFLMLVYFILSCNFHIAFVCNLLYGDICLSFIKKILPAVCIVQVQSWWKARKSIWQIPTKLLPSNSKQQKNKQTNSNHITPL